MDHAGYSNQAAARPTRPFILQFLARNPPGRQPPPFGPSGGRCGPARTASPQPEPVLHGGSQGGEIGQDRTSGSRELDPAKQTLAPGMTSVTVVLFPPARCQDRPIMADWHVPKTCCGVPERLASTFGTREAAKQIGLGHDVSKVRKQMAVIAVLAYVAVWDGQHSNAQGASFDCSKASNIVETLICADPNLSRLDDRTATAYAAARARASNPPQLLQEQRAWMVRRNQCPTAQCVALSYNQRIMELGGGTDAPDAAPAATAAAAPGTPIGQIDSPSAPQQTTRTTSDGKAIQTVIADGMGSTVESAVQNAAENALKQVVGSFIDTEKQVERRSQISEGIRTETRNVTSKMREYSQGFIQSFEVLETRQDIGIFRVSAKVEVRIDDFKVYIKKLAEGETGVGKGLFAQVATLKNNENGANQIFLDRIALPLLAGEVNRFRVGQPELVSQWYSKLNITQRRISDIAEIGFGMQRGEIGSSAIIVPVIVSMDENYSQTLRHNLAELASRKIFLSALDRLGSLAYPGSLCYHNEHRWCIALVDSNRPREVFVLENVLRVRHVRCTSLRECVDEDGLRIADAGSGEDRTHALFPRLTVALIASSGEILREDLFMTYALGKQRSQDNSVQVYGLPRNYQSENFSSITSIFDSREFYIVFDLSPDIVGRVDKISVKYVAP